ncbi:GNAT family N-acetyltransferase [Streptomyces sp. NPDC044780]
MARFAAEGDQVPWTRKAGPGDEAVIARLIPAALPASGPQHEARHFAEALCAADGEVPVPHGTGRLLVGGWPGTRTPAGLVYFLPPVRLVNAHADAGRTAQSRLATQITEIELLAVDPKAQRTGLGTALLRAAEQTARDHGAQILLAKVADSDFPVLRWWRHRGYSLASPGQEVRLALGWATVGCDDGGTGHRIAVAPAHPDGRVQDTGARLRVTTPPPPGSSEGAVGNRFRQR